VIVALAGGTGFTGRRVAARLAADGHALRCLVRATSFRGVLPLDSEVVEGDLSDAASIARWLAGAEALVYCASMGMGHVPAVAAAADAAGVRRSVWVSTTAIFTSLPAASKSMRLQAEECARGSAAVWTIIRPTMIYGARGDRNIERLLRWVARWPVVPVPGSGRASLQPVHVDDLANAIVAALTAPAAERNAYAVSGRAPLSLDATIDAAAAAVGRRRAKLHLPLRPVAWALAAPERVGWQFPVSSEQVRRLAEDKAFAHDDAARDLGFAPRAFEDGISEEARALGLATGAAP
jgi:nucleoside-diphosphate-sugar epimerase